MQDSAFKTDLMNIRLGWSARAAVTQRAAVLMDMDDSADAYELALEIEVLQQAEAETFDLGWREGADDQEEWLLDRTVWAKMAVQAHRLRRSFWMPAGATPEQAATEARRIYFDPAITAADVFSASRAVSPITQIAAE